jgi:tellurite resistance protein TerC
MIAVFAADIAFAVDSIPAAFAVTRYPLVIWTANAFALLGLGSLLAIVEILVRRFRYIDATAWTHSRTPISSSDCRSSAGSR